jgi:hypothetical protein
MSRVQTLRSREHVLPPDERTAGSYASCLSKPALQWAVSLSGLVPVNAGLGGRLLGPGMVVDPANGSP